MEYKKFDSKDKKQYYLQMENLVQEYNSNGKKTVVLVTDNFYPIVDGVLKVVENYAKHLKDRVNVLICAPTHKWKVPDYEHPVLFCDSTYFGPVKYDYSRASSDKKFKKILDKLRIDLMHIHSPYFTGRFMIEYANKNHIPVVSTFHTQYHRDLKRILKLDSIAEFALDLVMKVFHLSDKVLVLNTACLQTLKSYGFDGEYQILHNGTDMTFDGNKQELDDLCNKTFNLSADDMVFLFVGRLIKPKNIYLVLDALKIAFDRGEKFKMLYVGDGEETARLKAKIKSYGMEDCVFLTGKILDRNLLKSLYCRADLFLFPSVYDSDSVVKYEAAAFGTPSLLLRGSNDACSVVENETGFMCNGDPADMADQMQRIISNPDLLAHVGKTAQTDLYNPWDKIVDQIYELYMEMIAKNEQNPIYKGTKNMREALKHQRKRVKKGRKNAKFVKKARIKIAQKQHRKNIKQSKK